MSKGVDYDTHMHTFPEYYKQFLIKSEPSLTNMIKKNETKTRNVDETNFSKTDEDILNQHR